jgi:hypothetical protein
VLRIPPAPSLAERAGLGVARVSYASLLHGGVMEQFSSVLASLAAEQGEHLRTGWRQHLARPRRPEPRAQVLAVAPVTVPVGDFAPVHFQGVGG